MLIYNCNMIRRGKGTNRNVRLLDSGTSNFVPTLDIAESINESDKDSKELLKLIRSKMDGVEGIEAQKVKLLLERLKTTDDNFGEVSKAIQYTWALDADRVLRKALAAAEVRLDSTSISLSEISTFIKVVNQESRVNLGLPTQIQKHSHSHVLKEAKSKTDQELDDSIIELQRGLGYTVEDIKDVVVVEGV